MKIVIKDSIIFNELLIRKGYSKRRLAELSEISPPMIVQICNGQRSPSAAAAKKIVEALGLEFDDLFIIERKLA